MRLAGMWWFTFLIFVIGITLTKTDKLNKANGSYRLPKSIQPVQYSIVVEPIINTALERGSFNGSIKIEFKILENTNNITIHTRNLSINEDTITINHSNGSPIKFVNTTQDEARQLYIINLENELLENENYDLIIGQYSGTLSFDNAGFYLAKYNNPFGKEKILALTDFQPAGARKAFPCFDEPALKAKYLITIIRSENYTSVSNEKLLATENLGNGRFKDTFEETVPMSTYLVAFAVSDYDHTVQDGRFRIFAKPGAVTNGEVDYVLSFSEGLLEELEKFTSINYTLSKLDLFGVPSDYFEAGGMENWGLITYSESNLFCSNSSTFDLQNCFTFSGHELAHQWFGNLVTPSWWKYLWLSEGFATYLQYYIPSTIKPSWKLMDQFVVLIQQQVLKYDGKATREPLNYDPRSIGGFPSPIIAYYKGACIIRMAKHFLTKDIFEAGVRKYLQKNQFGAVEPSDLYDAFQQAQDAANANKLLGTLNVSRILQTWDSANSYPLINVSRNYQNGSVTFSQGKFFPRLIFEIAHKWNIPINYVFYLNCENNYSDTTANFWLTGKSTIVDNLPTESWMLVNKLQTGYFRVNYDVVNWNRLIAFLNTENFTNIHTVNRAQLIDDAFALAELNYIPYEIPLNLSKYLIREQEYIPLTTFLNAMDTLNLIMMPPEKFSTFQNYVMHLLSGVYNYLGFQEKDVDTHLDKLNRINILAWLCRLGHSECRHVGLQKLREWKSNNRTSVPLDLETPLYCGAMQLGTDDDWNFLYSKYITSNYSRSRKNRFLSLSCSENEALLNRFLDITFNSNSTLSIRDRRAAFTKVVESGNKGLRVAFDYVSRNFLELNEIKTKVATILGNHITSTEYVEKLEKLENPILDTRRIIRTTYLYGRRNLNGLQKSHSEEILKWMMENRNNY